MAKHATQCYSLHHTDKFIEDQYAVSESGKVFYRTVYHPNAHSNSGWKEVGGLPANIRYYDTTHQIWILPG